MGKERTTRRGRLLTPQTRDGRATNRLWRTPCARVAFLSSPLPGAPCGAGAALRAGSPRARRCARQGYYTTKRGAHPPRAGATPRVWAGAIRCHPRAIPRMTCPAAASGNAAYSSPEIAASENAPAPFPGMYPITSSFRTISSPGQVQNMLRKALAPQYLRKIPRLRMPVDEGRLPSEETAAHAPANDKGPGRRPPSRAI